MRGTEVSSATSIYYRKHQAAVVAAFLARSPDNTRHSPLATTPFTHDQPRGDPPGIVIKYESMEYRAAVHHAALVLDLASKSKKYMRELFEPPDVGATVSIVEKITRV